MQNHRSVPTSETDEYALVSNLELVYEPLYASQTRKRFGYSFTYGNTGLTYQYPLDKLEYLTDEKYNYEDCTLGSGSFDMRCTNIYKDLNQGTDSLIFKRELGNFIACSKVPNSGTS